MFTISLSLIPIRQLAKVNLFELFFIIIFIYIENWEKFMSNFV